MFHDGDLQSGIASALSTSKSVVCFVTDGNEESTKWESGWLLDDRIAAVLSRYAVLLRIVAGSPEAGFLTAFCPVSNIPTIVIIKDAQLRDNISIPVEQDEFVARVLAGLSPSTVTTGNEAAIAAPGTPSSHVQPGSPASPPAPMQSIPPAAVLPSPRQTNDTSSPSTTPISALRTEREARLAAQPTTVPAPSASQSSQTSYLHEQRQRQLDARQERARVMAQIEADKAARKARREEERHQNSALQSSLSPITSTPKKHTSTQSTISIRQLDGSTLRSIFPSTAKLDPDVREWLESTSPETAQQGSYTFKQILSPAPARPLSMSDERETLGDIGLVPGAMLVLVPAAQQGMVGAYTAGGWGVWEGVSGLVGSVAGALGLSGSGAPSTGEASSNNAAALHENQSGGTPGGVRIRSLADQNSRGRKEDQEFYNGNQTNFQSRDDYD